MYNTSSELYPRSKEKLLKIFANERGYSTIKRMKILNPVLASSLDGRGRNVAVAQANTSNSFTIAGSPRNIKEGKDTERMN